MPDYAHVTTFSCLFAPAFDVRQRARRALCRTGQMFDAAITRRRCHFAAYADDIASYVERCYFMPLSAVCRRIFAGE